MTQILFLSSDACCLSLVAQAFAQHRYGDQAVTVAARIGAGPKNCEISSGLMREIGVDMQQDCAEPLGDMLDRDYDIAITITKTAARLCPLLTGNPIRVDWELDEPCEDRDDPDAIRASLLPLRDEIEHRVTELFEHGYAASLNSAKHQSELLMNSISEGVIAHGFDRRIFYFNKAAERITEYDRKDVLGRDCHDAFPGGGMCGGKCAFQDPENASLPNKPRQMEITTRSGEKKQIESIVNPIEDNHGNPVAVVASFRDLTRETEMQRRLGEIEQFSGIIGSDPKMQELYGLIRDVADSSVSVLVQGESGTGKELVAAAIHNESPRSGNQFVPVNCGALPENLLESELFGHVRGAFTGAIRDKKGRFELADKGTIFLDEIGDISQAMQVKLLRVLQEGTFERVGGEKTMRVDVRVISATNKNLHDEIASGNFREDLFYRLSVVPIHLPPLRERINDVPILARHLLERMLKDDKRDGIEMAPESLDALMNYHWPGNVRELQNWLQFALVKCKTDMIYPQDLPLARAQGLSSPLFQRPQSDVSPMPAVNTYANHQHNHQNRRRRKLDPLSVRQALRETGGNKLKAAELLGVARATLYRFLNDYPELAE